MTDKLKMLFVDNPEIDEAIQDFCAQYPQYLKIKQEFYETAEEIAAIAGYDLYNRFEQCFGIYLARATDLYYLFGLGLRQEVLSALQSEMA